jgi:hypothetical protein
MLGNAAGGPFARQHQPVFFLVVIVEAEADPEAGDFINAGGNAGVCAEAVGQFVLQ